MRQPSAWPLRPQKRLGRPRNPTGRPSARRRRPSQGRLGGLKGGPARAKTLSATKRKAIAKKAAAARWKGQP